MPGERIRHYSVFYKGRRVGKFSAMDLTIASNDEAQLADEGYVGHSDGPITSTLETDAIVPVAGIGVTILQDMLSKKYVDIGKGIVDGKILTTSMKITQCQYTADPKNGTLNGKFRFEGGAPTVTG